MNILFVNVVCWDGTEKMYADFRQSLLDHGYAGKFLALGDRKIDAADWSVVITDEQKKRYRIAEMRCTTVRALPLALARDVVTQDWDWVIYSDVDMLCYRDVASWLASLDAGKEVLVMPIHGPLPAIPLLRDHERASHVGPNQALRNGLPVRPRSTMVAVRGDKVVEFFTAWKMAASGGDYNSENSLAVALIRGDFRWGFLHGIEDGRLGENVFVHKPMVPASESPGTKTKCCGQTGLTRVPGKPGQSLDLE